MKRRTALKTGGAVLLGPLVGCTQRVGIAAASDEIIFNSKLVTVGNSLIDQSVDMVHSFRNRRGTLTPQSIPGASMHWNWDHAGAGFADAKATLQQSRQDVWMGVESVPFRHVQAPGDVCDPDAWKDWYDLAISAGVKRFFVFEAWHDLQSGSPSYDPEDKGDPDTGIPWRERLDFARPHWLSIGEHVNSRRASGQPTVNLIPGGAMLARIYDDIATSRAPASISRIEDLFFDTIHPNIRGRYAMACIMFACIFRRDPTGLPARTEDIHGGPFERVPKDEAVYFQQLAWETAMEEPFSGLTG